MITLPSRNGWEVSWFTGETKTIRYKNGKTRDFRVKNSFESRSKEEVMRKREELEKAGYEIEMVSECIF